MKTQHCKPSRRRQPRASVLRSPFHFVVLSLFLLLNLVEFAQSQAVCTIWTGFICIKFECTPAQAQVQNDSCQTGAPPSKSPTLPPLTKSPTLVPSTASPSSRSPTTRTPTLANGETASPVAIVVTEDTFAPSQSPTKSPPEDPLPPDEECQEDISGVVVCCLVGGVCFVGTGVCVCGCCTCTSVICLPCMSCAPCKVVCCASPGCVDCAPHVANEASLDALCGVCTGGCCMFCVPMMAGRIDDDEFTEEELALIGSGRDTRTYHYCCCLFCCFIPLRKKTWKRKKSEKVPIEYERSRLQWKKSGLEMASLATMIMFVASLWIVLSQSRELAMGVAVATSEIARSVGLSACGSDMMVSLNSTLNEADDLFLMLASAQIATWLMVGRLTVRCLLTFLALYRVRSVLPKLRFDTLFFYFKLTFFGVLYAGVDPWLAALQIWNDLDKRGGIIDTEIFQKSDSQAAHDEVVTLSILMFFEKVPFVIIEVVLAFAGKDVFTTAALMDIAVNGVSMVMQIFEWISVYEIPRDLAYHNSRSVRIEV